MPEPAQAQWFRTDEALEAVLALEMVAELLTKASENLYYWKWVVIALHNSLQGFMVLSLQGTDGLNVLTTNCAKEWLLAYEQKNGLYPKPKLEPFLGLYTRIKSKRMLLYTTSRRFHPKGTQTSSVKKLNELRNEFIHFVPKSWLIEISGLPRIVLDCVNTIEFLALECGNVIWYDESLEKRTKEVIAQLRDQIITIKTIGAAQQVAAADSGYAAEGDAALASV